MTSDSIHVRTGEAPDVKAFLEQRLDEHNSAATGCFEAESFSATKTADAGEILAGVCGYTWGGCCFVTYLWVREDMRHRGLGNALMESVEQYAKTKQCSVVLLSSHTFQAPDFYKRRGYEQQAVIPDYPLGHADIVFMKRLNRNSQ